MRSKGSGTAVGFPQGGGVEVTNPAGRGGFVLVCEHAGNFIPPELHDLGLAPGLLDSHIAWDPGALPVARELSRLLDAPLVFQRVSRLVYDCNRPPEAESAIPAISEIHAVPGNADLSPADRAARADGVYHPFREALAACIDARTRDGAAPVIVTVHSFTPVFKGVPRHLDVGILHDTDSRFADAVLQQAGAGGDLVVRRNEPYGPADGVTHTLRTHAVPRGLENVMIEIRNDRIHDAGSQAALAAVLARWLAAADRSRQAPDGV